MGSSVRWERFAVSFMGLFMIAIPLFTQDSSNHASIWAAELIGVALLAVSTSSLWFDTASGSEITEMVLAALLFAAPWALNYADYSGAARSAWIVSSLVFVVALAAYVEQWNEHRHHRQGMPRHGVLS